MFMPFLLPQGFSLNLPGWEQQRARMPARPGGDGGEREAWVLVGKRNKEEEKRKESSTCTPTSRGLLQLGPRGNYLSWRLAKAPGRVPLHLCKVLSGLLGPRIVRASTACLIQKGEKGSGGKKKKRQGRD